MSAATNELFPRSLIPSSIGADVREARRRLGWSQARLASKVTVTRWTIIRLERGAHLPTSLLVQRLERAMELPALVKGWSEAADPALPSHGPRVRLARRAAGRTLQEVAADAGVSSATLSRFERGLCRPSSIVGEEDGADGGIHSLSLALALGFKSAEELEDYCTARTVPTNRSATPAMGNRNLDPIGA